MHTKKNNVRSFFFLALSTTQTAYRQLMPQGPHASLFNSSANAVQYCPPVALCGTAVEKRETKTLQPLQGDHVVVQSSADARRGPNSFCNWLGAPDPLS